MVLPQKLFDNLGDIDDENARSRCVDATKMNKYLRKNIELNEK